MNDQSNQGLFSEEVSPKRENPYKKKRVTQERRSHKEGATVPSTGKRRSLRERVSDFWFEHVRLTVFIIAMLILFFTLGPLSIYEISQWVEETRQESQAAQREPLTMGRVRILTDSGKILNWRDFAPYSYRISESAEGYVTWMLPVGERYEIRIGGQGTEGNPDYIYLYDMETGDRMDLRKDSLTSFLATRS